MRSNTLHLEWRSVFIQKKKGETQDISTFNFSSDHEDDDEIVDMNNLDTTIQVSPTPTIRIHKDHPLDQVIEVKNASKPMETQKPLLKDEDVCACARYQVNLKVSHLHVVKRILRYLKGHLKLGLWYLKDSPFDLVAYTGSDYAGESLDRKSTTGGCQFLGCRLISWQCKKQTMATTVNGEGQLQALVDGKKLIITESNIRRDLQLEDIEGVDCLPIVVIFEQLTLIGKPRRKVTKVPQPSDPTSVAYKTVNEEMDDSLERVATAATGLDAEQDIGVNTSRSGKDSLKFNELMKLCTKLQQRVLDLETTKTTQALEINSLKRRVKTLEKRKRSRTYRLKRLCKFGISARVKSSKDKILGCDSRPEQGTTSTTRIIITAASTRPKAKGLVIHEQEQAPTPTVSSQQPSQVKDNSKGNMVKLKHVKKLSKKDQLMIDEELTFKLQAEEEEEEEKEERLAREKAQQIKEVSIAWDDVQAKIDADYELTQRLQAEEQEELTDAEKAKLFMQFLEKKRKFFAAKRAEEKRNRPPTRAQQRSIMSMKKLNTFVDFKPELVEESLKKAEAEITQESSLKTSGDELKQERSKKQKVEDDKEEDLEVLWRLVKARFEKVKPVNHMDSFLLHNLKTMFEHHVKDNVWKNQQGLVKMYPLTNHTLYQMFNDVKLQVDYECEMAFELLRLVKKQLKEGYVPKEDHEEHLKLILELLKKEELYAKFLKCEFWLLKVQFLGHVIDKEGIHVDPTKIDSIKDWTSPKIPTEIR
nr:putative ribonuclease H-like domain-containing protein [Tanacetum cinerariifolium]